MKQPHTHTHMHTHPPRSLNNMKQPHTHTQTDRHTHTHTHPPRSLPPTPSCPSGSSWSKKLSSLCCTAASCQKAELFENQRLSGTCDDFSI